jgi:energy-coupling factor transport system ATP-binding protein
MSFQNPATQLSQVTETVYEEVAFGALNLGLERGEVIARTSQALATLRIEHLAERDPRQLSGGQQQLVAVAGLLAMRPRHLVLDEPTAQLDPEGAQLVGGALATLAEHGTGLLITEHNTDLLARVCSRVIVLSGGSVVFAGDPRSVFADWRLADLGVEAPAAVTLSRALSAAGLDPGVLA